MPNLATESGCDDASPRRTKLSVLTGLPFLRFGQNDRAGSDKSGGDEPRRDCADSVGCAQSKHRRSYPDWSGAPLVTDCPSMASSESSDEDMGDEASVRALAEGTHLQVQACILRLKSTSPAPTEASFVYPDELELRLAMASNESGSTGVLQVNGVTVPGSEAFTVLRRDRQGCYVSTDQLALTQSTTIEVSEEGHTWACGRFVYECSEKGESSWNLEFFPFDPSVVSAPTCSVPAAMELEMCVVGKNASTPCCLQATVECIPSSSRSTRSAMFRQPSLPSVCEDSVMDEESVRSPRSKLPPLADLYDLKDKTLLTYFDPAIEYARGDGSDPSWFGAGVRVGMGIGLGVCLGIGLGAGLLMSSYQRAQAAVKRITPGGDVLRLTNLR